jgi:hypothetical protein
MRNPIDIRAELDRLSEQRTRLWKDLALGHDAAKATECRRVSKAIEALWLELRDTSVRARFGPRDRVIARARAEARLEDELNRRISGLPRARRRPASSAAR